MVTYLVTISRVYRTSLDLNQRKLEMSIKENVDRRLSRFFSNTVETIRTRLILKLNFEATRSKIIQFFFFLNHEDLTKSIAVIKRLKFKEIFR